MEMENRGIFYDRLVYFTAIGNILWPFGIVCGHLVFLPPFWDLEPRKIWQPWSQHCVHHYRSVRTSSLWRKMGVF
jgi:hypothetical protein